MDCHFLGVYNWYVRAHYFVMAYDRINYQEFPDGPVQSAVAIRDGRRRRRRRDWDVVGAGVVSRQDRWCWRRRRGGRLVAAVELTHRTQPLLPLLHVLNGGEKKTFIKNSHLFRFIFFFMDPGDIATRCSIVCCTERLVGHGLQMPPIEYNIYLHLCFCGIAALWRTWRITPIVVIPFFFLGNRGQLLVVVGHKRRLYTSYLHAYSAMISREILGILRCSWLWSRKRRFAASSRFGLRRPPSAFVLKRACAPAGSEENWGFSQFPKCVFSVHPRPVRPKLWHGSATKIGAFLGGGTFDDSNVRANRMSRQIALFCWLLIGKNEL